MTRRDLESSDDMGDTSISDVDLCFLRGTDSNESLVNCRVDVEQEGCIRGGIDIICFGNLPVLPVRRRYSSAC